MAKNLISKLLSQSPGPVKGSTPPKAAAGERAGTAAEHAEMARFAVEDGSVGNEERHRLGKAIRAAKGLRNKTRDNPDTVF
ncbi:hypothetical protein GCM10009639_54110 [Kitasatospora putterlickiae]|uniref:Uncharacterized protein n=1 Tax=Kitasatospora putterlickiae TaxID=221725 RepID=A0ABN1YDS9_9ACTN